MKRNKKSKHNIFPNKPTEVKINEDKDVGILYKIQQSDIMGRYLVAAKDIPGAEIIVNEEPLVVGPCQETEPMCLGCYVNIDLKDSATYQRCAHCSWPLCKQECSGCHREHGHSKNECDIFSKTSIREQPISNFRRFYYALAPLRCLIMKKTYPDKWKILQSMETHTEERQKSTVLWETNEKMAVEVIRKHWGLSEFSEEEIHFVCGVLEVNAFEINLQGTRTQCLRAVYPTAFLFAHDCVPNTCRSNGDDFRLTVRTTRTVRAGEMITVSYAYTLQCTLKRRLHLKNTKFFSCQCKRCSDPTELGTYLGAVKCFTCKEGHFLPEYPLNDDGVWKCTSRKCNRELQVSQIIPILDRLFNELDSIKGNDVNGYEKFLSKCNRVFHENHYLSLSAMHCLSQLYGKIHGYLINDLTDEQLQRKEEICRKLIKMFGKLEPGQSKQRGILLYELQAPLMVSLRRRFQNLPKKEIKSKIKEILKYLEEAFLILSKEPETSPEGQMAIAAQEAATSLRTWMSCFS